jgi:general secretion pathway protein D
MVGYYGPLRIDYPADQNAAATDIANIRAAGPARFDPDEKISLKFNKATLDYFLAQMLGGALGLNYIATPDLGGSVTFQTETPIPKGQVLQIVRDVLSRNGLQMTYLNGIYHVARPEVIASLEQSAAAGRTADQVTRVVRVRKGSTNELLALLRQLVPDDIGLFPANGGNAIVVRAPPGDLDRVSDLINSLADSGVMEDRVAIIPLHQSAPATVAQQLMEIYGNQAGGAGGESVTVMPLENQQAILVKTKDRRVMEGIRSMTLELDRDWRDEFGLRLIPLKHLGADEVAEQLATILTQTGTTGPGRVAAVGVIARGAAAAGDNAGNLAPPGGGARGGGQVLVEPTAGNSGGSNIKIVADARSNSVMIYSTYSMFKRVAEVLKALDVPQTQVVIEATVGEVDITDNLEKGVQWFLQGVGLTARASTEPTPADPGKTGLFVHSAFTLGAVNVDMVMNALQEITKVKVISSPYLTVVDGKTARLVIGDQIPYAVRTQTATITGTVTVTQEVQAKDTGIILEITPKIRADNSVMLEVHQSVTTPSESVKVGNLTPVIATREVKSDLLVQSGRSILLAGLIQDRIDKGENRVPVLGTVPILGELFKQTTDKGNRVELIVMITPRVIRHSTQLENITRMLRGQMSFR